MNNFSITDNYIEVASEKQSIKKINFKHIKSVKIVYYHTYFQKLINIFPKVNKKSYKFIVFLKNEDKQVFEITENEKNFLKHKLEFISTQIKIHNPYASFG